MVNKYKFIKLIFLTLLITIVIGGSVVSPKVKADTIPGVSGSNYTQITNNGPVPADFRPFRYDSVWNTRLPENPQNIDATNSTNIRTYAANTGPTLFITEANDAFTNCVSPCAGVNETNPLYVATNSDPAVSINCSGVGYGCYIDSFNPTSSIPGTFYIPANVRSGDVAPGDDAAFDVLQPDGTELAVYGCYISRDWVSGDVIGGTTNSAGCRADGVTIANVVTGNGYTEGSGSGDSPLATMTFYNEVVPAGATIKHALNFVLSCYNGVVYPGSYLGPSEDCPAGEPGVPTGSRIHLSLSHARIDALITQGTLSAAMRPFFYALHDYGAYTLDGGNSGCTVTRCITPDAGLKIEDAAPWVKNGNTNPWIPWFQAQPGVLNGIGSSGNPEWWFRAAIWQPIAPYLDIVSPCYAQGNCPDSLDQGSSSNPTASLEANPTSITVGSTSTLTWSTTNATQVSISPSVGTVASSGSTSVSPSATTTYTITATNSSGSANASTTVTVNTSNPSPDGTHLPPASSITDNSGNVWTLASRIFYENGIDSTGVGSQLLFYHNNIYGLGTDFNWWQWTGSTWISVGPNDPSGALKGDLNYDHIVNSIDWSIMNSQWFTNNSQSDLNHDGIVNSIDFSILNANWFKTW